MKRSAISQSVFYLLTVVMPVVLWLGAPGSQFNASNQALFLNSIARGAGIVGISLFAGNLLLSGRYLFLDWAFQGLDKVYLFHRRTGKTAFTLLCIHALFLTLLPLMFSTELFWSALTDFSDKGIVAARVGFSGFLIVILITLFFHKGMKYEKLHALHKTLGAFFFLGGLHAYLIPSDLSFIMPLRWYTFSLVVLALASFGWRTLGGYWLTKRIGATVTAVNRLGGSVTEIVMRPLGDVKIHFKPGQFIFVWFDQDGFPREIHPFSLTASTEEKALRISAKEVGDFTKNLPTLKPGALAYIQGPFGGFSFKNAENKKQLWIAGGIGITPFLSGARTLRDELSKTERSAYTITLFYSVQKPDDLVFQEELATIAKTVPGFTLIPWITKQQGYISAEALAASASLSDTEVFICGPQPMMLAITRGLIKAGVPASRIHFELFKLL